MSANQTDRSVFRAEAMRRYIQGRETSVLPEFVSPRTFIYLWIMLGLLLAAVFAAWFVRVPVYISGTGVVVDGSNTTPDEEALIVAFLPPGSLSRLRAGQTLFLAFDTRRERLSTTLHSVEGLMSPEATQTKYELGPGAAAAITQPAAVVLARLEPAPGDFPTAAYAGSVVPVTVEVGSRRVLSLLPWIGPLLERRTQ